MKSFRNLFLLISVLIYANIFFGPLVRATDSGLACPDWPLCHGKFIPEYTFQIAMEVGHRFYSGAIGLIILSGFLWSILSKDLRRYVPLTSLTMFFLVTQVTLGALTVTKLLDPTTVNLHLLNASLLLLLSVTISTMTSWDATNRIRAEFQWRNLLKPGAKILGFLVLLTAYQLFMGGRVSSHYSGLACPDFPTCYGEWFPEMIGTIRYQMEHRWVGYFLAVSIFVGALLYLRNHSNPIAKKFLLITSGLIILQILIGAINVWYRIPKLITGIHTITGVTILVCLYFAFLNHFFFSNSSTEEGES